MAQVLTKSKRSPANDSVRSLCKNLHQMALARGTEAKLPTVRELSDQYGISMTTVSDALQELEQRKIIYRRQGSGIFVSPKIHTKSIVVLYDTSVADQPGLSPFWGMLWAALIKEAQIRSETCQQEFTFRMTSSSMHPDSLVPADLMQRIGDGLVHGVMGIGLSTDAANIAAVKDIPLVAFAGGGYWHVEFDPLLEVREALNVLVERDCRTIGLWRTSFPYEHHPVYPDVMLAAFADQLAARSVPFHPELVRDYWKLPAGQFRGTHQQQGYRLAMETFGPGSSCRPDGLIILDDMMTSGALFAFGELGMKHEESVKIATVANAGSTVLFGYEKSLILIEHDPREVALAMLRALDTLMSGHEVTDKERMILPNIRLPEQYSGVLHGL